MLVSVDAGSCVSPWPMIFCFQKVRRRKPPRAQTIKATRRDMEARTQAEPQGRVNAAFQTISYHRLCHQPGPIPPFSSHCQAGDYLPTFKLIPASEGSCEPCRTRPGSPSATLHLIVKAKGPSTYAPTHSEFASYCCLSIPFARSPEHTGLCCTWAHPGVVLLSALCIHACPLFYLEGCPLRIHMASSLQVS